MSALIVTARHLTCKRIARNVLAKRETAATTGGAFLSTSGAYHRTAEEVTDNRLGGFAKSLQKFTSEPKPRPPTEAPSFAALLRNSKFIDLGDPEGKVVTGKIFHIVDNDLYIDFGWKFHCVCPRPTQQSEKYVRGANVRLRIKDLELSTKFLGSEKDLTILEADAVLIGLMER